MLMQLHYSLYRRGKGQGQFQFAGTFQVQVHVPRTHPYLCRCRVLFVFAVYLELQSRVGDKPTILKKNNREHASSLCDIAHCTVIVVHVDEHVPMLMYVSKTNNKHKPAIIPSKHRNMGHGAI